MTTILFPAASQLRRAEFGNMPVEILEVDGKMIMEYALQPFLNLKRKASLIALVHNSAARETGLDTALSALTNQRAEIVRLNNYTQGSVCTCMMAADRIDPDEPLVVAALDQVISAPLEEIFEFFEKNEADGGVITFPSRNPKFSYAAVQNGLVFQTTEKRPISPHALAGIYYFRRGAFFLDAAQKQLYKRVPQHNGMFFLSGTINELVIEGKKVLAYEIPSNAYHKFYTPYMLEAFAHKVGANEPLEMRLEHDARRYVDAFNARDLKALAALLSDTVVLDEIKRNRFIGKEAVLGLLASIFEGKKLVRLEVISLHTAASDSVTTLEFKLTIDQEQFQGIDVITWENGKIVDLQAYVL